MDESSGTRKTWTPARWPVDKTAANQLRQWLDESGELEFDGLDLDFRSADLSDADFTESWLSRSDLRGVGLRQMVLYRGHAEEADFSGADMEGADLVRASLSRANFTGARLVDARLGRAEVLHAVFVDANLAGADFGDGSLSGSDLTGADLTAARANGLGLMGCRFDHTHVTGFHGTAIGPITVSDQGKDVELDGEDMEHWFARHGAEVTCVHHVE
ncbi:MAG TPA: pentapeptide repeat-containing protein [Pseudonocardiaceae bacterium]